LSSTESNERQPLRIAVTGASGLIGSTLSNRLRSRGHSVVRMVRRPSNAHDAVYWNVERQEIDAAALEGIDAMIHLAGEPLLSLKWTDEKKRRIRDSRVLGTRLISTTLAGLSRRPGVFISASAVGIYGDRGSEILTEASTTDSSSFLAQVCTEWERETDAASDAGIRTVRTRTGLVLSKDGGLIKMLLPLFKLGLGGKVGNGSMYMSWITLEDEVSALVHCIESELSGPVNLTAPNPATMKELTDTLGRVLHRPAFFSMPGGLLRLASRDLTDEMILSSARVLPQALLDSGFTFGHSDLTHALESVLNSNDR